MNGFTGIVPIFARLDPAPTRQGSNVRSFKNTQSRRETAVDVCADFTVFRLWRPDPPTQGAEVDPAQPPTVHLLDQITLSTLTITSPMFGGKCAAPHAKMITKPKFLERSQTF